MKTNVRAISIEAYHRHIQSGKALPQWCRILDYIKRHPNVTRAQLEKALGMRISSVCGRVNELKAATLVRESLNRITCPVTGEEAHTLRLATREEREQMDMFGVAA